ncbi:hypothetical protein [Robiginitalea sediminis]|uniref:hypothetical protein n=1 Tax=Robiginitalea sediminis TaxID=1982593 RepID=UPI000B4ADA69|nr:hypothetical protein [Robiginitalea sediminis]
MEIPNVIKARLAGVFFVLLGAGVAQAQCEVFKSEITDVKDYELRVSQLADSLKIHAEAAAFAAKYSEGRKSAKKAEFLAGEALSAAQEAVTLAAEAQHRAQLCGTDAVISHSVNAESAAIDARDLADEIYTNAKKASSARNLGDVHYYMRRALFAARQAHKRADAAAYAAYDAYHSCGHKDGVAARRGE